MALQPFLHASPHLLHDRYAARESLKVQFSTISGTFCTFPSSQGIRTTHQSAFLFLHAHEDEHEHEHEHERGTPYIDKSELIARPRQTGKSLLSAFRSHDVFNMSVSSLVRFVIYFLRPPPIHIGLPDDLLILPIIAPYCHQWLRPRIFVFRF